MYSVNKFNHSSSIDFIPEVQRSALEFSDEGAHKFYFIPMSHPAEVNINLNAESRNSYKIGYIFRSNR